QAVEPRITGQATYHAPGMMCVRRRLAQNARGFDVEGPKARALGIGSIQNLAVGRQAAPVRAEDRMSDLFHRGAVGQGVVDPAMVAMTGITLAQIGEIE